LYRILFPIFWSSIEEKIRKSRNHLDVGCGEVGFHLLVVSGIDSAGFFWIQSEVNGHRSGALKRLVSRGYGAVRRAFAPWAVKWSLDGVSEGFWAVLAWEVVFGALLGVSLGQE
jgi:hypothetical protein